MIYDLQIICDRYTIQPGQILQVQLTEDLPQFGF
jgi:hypothetical protein